MNKYRIQVSCDVNGDYESSIVDNYEIEETSVDKAINKAEKSGNVNGENQNRNLKIRRKSVNFQVVFYRKSVKCMKTKIFSSINF